MRPKKSHAAIAGGRSDVVHVDPTDLVIVGLDTPEVDRAHPLYDEKLTLPLDHAKVQIAKERGIIYPVLARKNGDKAEVVDGRTRVRWARQANAELEAEGSSKRLKVKVIFTRGEDKDAAALKVILNGCREEMPPLMGARAAQDLLSMGFSQGEVSAMCGVGVEMLQERLALLDLDPKVQALVDSGDLTISRAAKLSRRVPREEQLRQVLADEAAKAARPRPPTSKLLLELARHPKATAGERALLRWCAGDTTRAAAAETCTWLEETPGNEWGFRKAERPARDGAAQKARLDGELPRSAVVHHTTLEGVISCGIERDLATTSSSVGPEVTCQACRKVLAGAKGSSGRQRKGPRKDRVA